MIEKELWFVSLARELAMLMEMVSVHQTLLT